MSTDTIETHGVVGAGGGGFPTAVKLATQVPTFIVNGAERVILLPKDQALIRPQATPQHLPPPHLRVALRRAPAPPPPLTSRLPAAAAGRLPPEGRTGPRVDGRA